MLRLSSNSIVNNVLHVYCHNTIRGECPYERRMQTFIKNYVNNSDIHLKDCFFTMFHADKDINSIIESYLNSKNLSKEEHAQQRTKFRRFVIELPSLAMSIDWDSVFDRTKILIPDGEMLFDGWG